MKKKIAGLALVTLLVIGQASGVFAAGSSTIGAVSSSGSRSTTSATDNVRIEIPVVADAATQAQVGLSFALNEAATAGLPEQTVQQINSINKGSALSENIKDVELNNYNALIPTVAIVTKNPTTGLVNDQVTVPVTLHVPNLIAGLNNVQILYYNNVTGKWTLLTPVSVDYAKKNVVVNITGSGTLTVVYKK